MSLYYLTDTQNFFLLDRERKSLRVHMCRSSITNSLGTSKQSQLTDIYRTRGEMIVA